MALVTKGTSAAVRVIEDDGDGGLGNTGLSLLVDKFLEIGSPDLLQVSDAQNEADGIENVGLSGAVEPRYGVEEGVEARNHSPRRVRLEPFQAYLFYVHFFLAPPTRATRLPGNLQTWKKKKRTMNSKRTLWKEEI